MREHTTVASSYVYTSFYILYCILFSDRWLSHSFPYTHIFQIQPKIMAPKIAKPKATVKAASSQNSDALFFYGQSGPYDFLSQHYACTFTAPALFPSSPVSTNNPAETFTFHTTEQYMMYHKALLFGDFGTAVQIMATPNPNAQKALGRKVRGFDEGVWKENRERAVEEGNWWKFMNGVGTRTGIGSAGGVAYGAQVKGLKERLLETGERELVEASSSDRIWGIGFRSDNAEANRERWGLNLLGKALMQVRERLRATVKALFFYGQSGPYDFLSQHYACTFTAPALFPSSPGFTNNPAETFTFHTTEQYMMYHKALLFGDFGTAVQIMATPNPNAQKALGRKVRGFDEGVWKENRERAVEEGNWWKFMNGVGTRTGIGSAGGVAYGAQVKGLKERLLETGERELVQASSSDRIWGIGFRSDNAEANRERWGLNLLGKALMQVRERLRALEGRRRMI